MKVNVKKEGLLVPRKLLKGVKQADVTWENNRIVIRPTKIEADPIFTLGSQPGHSGLKDASTHNDKYLYEEA